MYKFIIPLFALAFLLVSCGGQNSLSEQSPSSYQKDAYAALSSHSVTASMLTFDGKILSGKHTVILQTTKGDVTLELDADAAPKTVTNFITLSKNGFYDGLTFHRVIPDFMIQGGDPNGDGTGGRSVFGATFEDEINADSYGLGTEKLADAAGGQQISPDEAKMTVKEYYEARGYVYNSKLKSLPLTRGAIAMANRGPNTNGSQFFIVQAAQTPWLNGQHTVFGHVTDGMDVLDAIANAPRDPSDRPVTPITFNVKVVN